MASNTYHIETLAPVGPSTIVVTDDGSGNDWLVMSAAHDNTSEINLSYLTSGTQHTPVQAAGFYLDTISTNPQVTEGNRLIVEGVIENARGSVGWDYITGNILANILYGDPDADGSGGRATTASTAERAPTC